MIPADVEPAQRARRKGHLTPGWTVTFALGWLAVGVAFAAVWAVSRQLGLSTWWLGPKAQPRPIYVTMVPFLPSVLLLAGAASGFRNLAWYGLAGAGVLAGVGIADLGRVASIAALELAIAVAAALVSLAAWSGTYRADVPVPAPNADTAPPSP